MKVLFCAYDRPGHLATGPNAWLQRLIPDLTARYGLDVHTLFIYNGLEKACPTMSYFKAQGLPLSAMNREQFPYVSDQVKALLKIVKKEAISLVVANLVIPALYATPYLKKANIPVIGVLHSNDAFYKGVIRKFIHGKTDDQLSATVAVSHYIGHLIEPVNTATQVKVIPCGTPVPKDKCEWTNTRVLQVMYAGRIVEEQKQVLKLTTAFLEAARHNSRLKFSIYGDGNHVQEVKGLLQQNPQDSVFYKGAVSPSDIIGCFQEHQVFTLMSDYEGMPVALMEAMACGLVPVCLEEASGVNEIIEHGVNGFIVKDRHQDYQKHLQILLDDTDLWQAMSKKAICTIKQNYSTEVTHKKWYDLLTDYQSNQTKKVKIPFRIKLYGDLLHYGDNRKPPMGQIWSEKIGAFYMKLRLLIRPRARIRAWLDR